MNVTVLSLSYEIITIMMTSPYNPGLVAVLHDVYNI